MICGETDPVVLDFDHRPGETKFEHVSTLTSWGRFDALLREMKKCDVLCANCHRRVTRKRFIQSLTNLGETYRMF